MAAVGGFGGEGGERGEEHDTASLLPSPPPHHGPGASPSPPLLAGASRTRLWAGIARGAAALGRALTGKRATGPQDDSPPPTPCSRRGRAPGAGSMFFDDDDPVTHSLPSPRSLRSVFPARLPSRTPALTKRVA